MEAIDQYNFSLFKPRNRHGRKNRNVIIIMISIWAVAVFGFQIVLRLIEKPTPEQALFDFEASWPKVQSNQAEVADYQSFLHSLLMVKGKNNAKPADKQLLDDAITLAAFSMLPDTLEPLILADVVAIKGLNAELGTAKDEAYLEIKRQMLARGNDLIEMVLPFTSFVPGSLEASILIGSLDETFPGAFTDEAFLLLPERMAFYLTHNQSVLTDTKFLGFPFHYFYSAVFLLVLFVVLCIVYNLLLEWRLKKEHVVE